MPSDGFRMEVDTDAICAAFDQLGRDGPRLAKNALMNLGQEAAAKANSKSPGRLGGAFAVHDLGDDDNIVLLVAPKDKALFPDESGYYHGGKPVARWLDKGTEFIRPRRLLQKVSKSKQRKAINNAIVRAARRAGFELEGPA